MAAMAVEPELDSKSSTSIQEGMLPTMHNYAFIFLKLIVNNDDLEEKKI